MNKFEKLIEYVINDEEQKARELFHEIVVEKSREIYESLMAEEDELDETKHEEIEEQEELDEGDAQDDLIDEIEADESNDMNMEAADDEEDAADMDMDMAADEEDAADMDMDMAADEEDVATKDDIMDVLDKMDELLQAFQNKYDDVEGDDMAPGMGADAIEVDDTEEMMPMAEAVTLKSAPAPVKSEESGVNKKSVIAANAGAKGPIGNTVKPVSTGTENGGHHDSSAYKNTTKDLIGKVGNTPAQSTQRPTPANKPHLAQATQVNNRSPLPGGRG